MNGLTDLNNAAIYFLDRGDIEALARCVEYSLQPEKIFEAIYQRKNYECLLPLLPLFISLVNVDRQHPLALNILLDLFERKEKQIIVLFPFMRGLDTKFLIEQAIERKIKIDFDNALFKVKRVDYYYNLILERDCVELFLIHKDDIESSIDDYHFYKILSQNYSSKILRHVGVNQELGGWCVTHVLDEVGRGGPSERKEELLRYLCSLYDYRDLITRDLLRSFDNRPLSESIFFARLLPKPDEETKQKLRAKNPELFTQLFGEDV